VENFTGDNSTVQFTHTEIPKHPAWLPTEISDLIGQHLLMLWRYREDKMEEEFDFDFDN